MKILSFSCSFCLASESQDRAIEAATKATGGRFVRAPVPTGGAEDVGLRERVYFAARDINAEFGERVKRSLYRGAQEAEVPLQTLMQLYVWIARDLPDDESYLTALFQAAQDLPSKQSVARAVRLADDGGVQTLPAYILLHKGEILAVIDNTTTTGSSMASLRTSVINNIETLSKKNGNTPSP